MTPEELAQLRAALTPLSEAPSNVNATSALPDDIRESVAVDDVKVIAGGLPAMATIHFGNLVSHSKRVDVLAETALGRNIDLLNNVGPLEARAATMALTGHDVAAQILQLLVTSGVVKAG